MQKVNILKEHGPDNITSREMKMVHAEFSHCIANMSFIELTSYFSEWKVFNVTTLFKSGVREDCGIYRPLTMLRIPRKLTESDICDR